MSCSIVNCNHSQTRNHSMTFYRFPSEDDRCEKWFKFSRRSDLRWPDDKHKIRKLLICEHHFRAEDFMNPADYNRHKPRKRLRHDVIPTMFKFLDEVVDEEVIQDITGGAVSGQAEELPSAMSSNVSTLPEPAFIVVPTSDLPTSISCVRSTSVETCMNTNREAAADYLTRTLCDMDDDKNMVHAGPMSEKVTDIRSKSSVEPEPPAAVCNLNNHTLSCIDTEHSYSRPDFSNANVRTNSSSVAHSSNISTQGPAIRKVAAIRKEDLNKNLLLFQQQGFMCDTCLVCEDGVLRVHGVVWSAASAVMHSKLMQHCVQSEHILVFPGISVSLMEVAVKFVYTNEIVIPQQYSSDSGLCIVRKMLSELGLISDVPIVSSKNGDATRPSLRPADKLPSTSKAKKSLRRHTKTGTKARSRKSDSVVNGHQTAAATADEDSNSTTPATVVRMKSVLKSASNEKSTKPQRDQSSNNEQQKLSSSQGNKGNETGIICDVCGLLCGASGLGKHRKSHFSQPPEYQCSQCGRKCSSNSALNRHMKLHTGERPFLCQFCGNSYITKDAMLDHMSTHSSDQLAKHGVNFAPFVCRKCGERFATSSKRTHHNKFTCKERFTSLVVSARTMRKNFFRQGKLDRKPPKPSLSDVQLNYPCSSCDKKFSSQLALAIHNRRHSFDVFIHCVLCDEKILKIQDFHRHLNSVHGVKTPFVCEFCNADFISAQVLYKHRRSYHTSRDSLSCGDCGKIFQSRGKLDDHKRLHTDSKASHCSTCNTDSRTSRELQHHRFIHSAKRQHSCETCGKSFYTERSLVFHRYSHGKEKPFKCSECERTFTTCTHLKRHLLTHSGIKPYTCSECTKAYKCRHDLRIHMKNVHEIELPVLCVRARVKVGSEIEMD